jgi:hypothetical protein
MPIAAVLAALAAISFPAAAQLSVDPEAGLVARRTLKEVMHSSKCPPCPTERTESQGLAPLRQRRRNSPRPANSAFTLTEI